MGEKTQCELLTTYTHFNVIVVLTMVVIGNTSHFGKERHYTLYAVVITTLMVAALDKSLVRVGIVSTLKVGLKTIIKLLILKWK